MASKRSDHAYPTIDQAADHADMDAWRSFNASRSAAGHPDRSKMGRDLTDRLYNQKPRHWPSDEQPIPTANDQAVHGNKALGY